MFCSDLYLTNSCINFFLYMGAGTKFRQDVKNLFREKSSDSYITSSSRSVVSGVRNTTSTEGIQSTVSAIANTTTGTADGTQSSRAGDSVA